MTTLNTDQTRLLLEELNQQLELGLTAKDNQDNQTAKHHLQRAETALLKLALNTPHAKLKEQRLEQSQRIKQMMTELVNKTPEKPTTETKIETPSIDENVAKFQPVSTDTTVTFDDVAGLDEVKHEIHLRMVLPFLHQQTAQQFGISNGGGLLLYGPPGTGKTLIAKATAGELDVPFFSIKPSDIVAKWFGESEQNIKDLFAATQQHERAVLFIDEIDALIPSRSKTNSSVMARIIPQFLTELDGFQKNQQSLLVIGATNEPQSLDPALLRPGRIDALVSVNLPDITARAYLFKQLLATKPLAADIDFDCLAQYADGLSGADIHNICNKALREAFEASLNQSLQVLTQDQLLTLIQQAPRSVSKKQLDQYQKFKDTYLNA